MNFNEEKIKKNQTFEEKTEQNLKESEEIIESAELKNQKEKEVSDEKKTKRFLKKNNKTQVKELEHQIQNLTTKNISLEIEAVKLKDRIKKLEDDFKNQVKNFEEKAIIKVKDLKAEMQKKLEEDTLLVKKYSLQPFFEEFLSPFINLQKAISFGKNSENSEISAYVRGFEMLSAQIEDVMLNFGLVKIVPKIGDFFDPTIHEIHQLVEGEKDKIFEVAAIGYKLHDRTIKTALVMVGKPNE